MSFCWEKPVANHLKANQDGSHKEYPDGSALGGSEYVIRDTLGEIVSLGVVPLSFALSSLEVEMAGFYLAVIECQRIRASNVIFEGDSKQVEWMSCGLPQSNDPGGVRQHAAKDLVRGLESCEDWHIFGALATFEDYKVVH
ncbi:hypothetical protein RHGRI_018797 [Rhododendron griersonianum]|uniref:RNase H type-1 domain-containing protein n=1 Tax=Rhododendron griersonianum TaxID=479676 RepID=A0AAV6K2X2_9ERIC|nr:hypothetical protein RHGRI_018797 [Rhododendron griersonianum]